MPAWAVDKFGNVHDKSGPRVPPKLDAVPKVEKEPAKPMFPPILT
jgi:hypothetical protein